MIIASSINSVLFFFFPFIHSLAYLLAVVNGMERALANGFRNSLEKGKKLHGATTTKQTLIIHYPTLTRVKQHESHSFYLFLQEKKMKRKKIRGWYVRPSFPRHMLGDTDNTRGEGEGNRVSTLPNQMKSTSYDDDDDDDDDDDVQTHLLKKRKKKKSERLHTVQVQTQFFFVSSNF